MKTPIETNQKFIFRLEDFVYLFLNAYLIPLGGIIYLFVRPTNMIPFIITISVIGFTSSIMLILFSYKRRLQYNYYIEDETIIKERNGKDIFRIPFKEIVSVRINDKKGTQGSVVFFTEPRSKHFTHYDTFYGFYNTPFAAFGFTKKKIDLVKNRKAPFNGNLPGQSGLAFH